MHHHQAVLWLGHIQKTRGASIVCRGVIQGFIHFIGQNPSTRLTTALQDGQLLLPAQGPSGRVVGRVQDQQARLWPDGGEQSLQIQLPTAVHHPQRQRAQMGTHDAGLGQQIGPNRCDGQHIVASVDQGLNRQHQCIHTSGGDGHTVLGDALPMGPRVVLAHVIGNGLAQGR